MDDKEFNEKILKLFPMLTPGSVVNIPCEVKSFKSVSDADVTGSKLSVTFKPIGMHCDGAYVICKDIDRLCDIITTSEPEEYDEILDMGLDDAMMKAKQAGLIRKENFRAARILRVRKQIQTLRDVTKCTERDLRRIGNIGDRSIICIKETLKCFNLSLKEDNNG